jgi:hypothetical protein
MHRIRTLSRHGRARPGHPDWKGAALQSIGITRTSPVMTSENVGTVPEHAPAITLSDTLPSS